MPAPAPYNASAGRVSISNIAKRIRGDYEWLYRWSNEMNADGQLEVKKLAQMVYRHCLSFRACFDALNDANAGPVSRHAVRTEFSSEGIAWADDQTMQADLTAIYNACLQLYTWVEANLPQAKSFATRTYDSQGNEIEQPVVIAKPAALQTRISQFRALFE